MPAVSVECHVGVLTRCGLSKRTEGVPSARALAYYSADSERPILGRLLGDCTDCGRSNAVLMRGLIERRAIRFTGGTAWRGLSN